MDVYLYFNDLIKIICTYVQLGTLTDINECDFNLHNCTNGAICLNSPGSFFCHCVQGYTGVACEEGLYNTCHLHVHADNRRCHF